MPTGNYISPKRIQKEESPPLQGRLGGVVDKSVVRQVQSRRSNVLLTSLQESFPYMIGLILPLDSIRKALRQSRSAKERFITAFFFNCVWPKT